MACFNSIVSDGCPEGQMWTAPAGCVPCATNVSDNDVPVAGQSTDQWGGWIPKAEKAANAAESGVNLVQSLIGLFKKNKSGGNDTPPPPPPPAKKDNTLWYVLGGVAFLGVMVLLFRKG